jgi:CIC family chloride channel protein
MISVKLESILEQFKNHYYKAVIGGLILCSLIFLLPPIYGEGYDTIIKLLASRQDELISGSFLNSIADPNLSLIIFISLIILAKVIATSLTIGSGGNGGIIAPSLFTGALTGLLIVQLTKYFGIVQLNSANFIVVGMGGVLSGVLHAPLTGIFLIAEITGGYVLIVPLMIVTAISYFVSRFFHANSIYTTSLAKMGIKFRSEKEKYFVQHISISDLVESDFDVVSPCFTLRELIAVITHTKRNIFPVVDKDNSLLGIVTLDDVREMLLDDNSYDIILVSDIMNPDIKSVDINTDINKAIEIFEKENIWNLPVTDKGKYLGFISKSNIFNRYVTVWAKQQEDGI